MKNTRQMADTAKIQTKSLPLEVKSNNPFKEDALGREELCKKWTNFIVQSTTPYVMAIDGRWGDGKTTLLRMWKAYLNNNGFKCVLFNAWKADFYSHALPALIGTIVKEISDDDFSDKTKNISGKKKNFTAEIENFKNGVKRIANILSKPDTALKVIAPIIPGGDAITEIYSAIKKLPEDYDAIEDYKKYHEAVKEFKDLLQEFSTKISRDSGKPLVIFIDELDRCRPDFALDVLEKVKHAFDVESVFFVIAINKGEMEKTVKTVYGKIDAANYLRKFFDHAVILTNKRHLGEQALAKSGLEDHLQKRRKWLKDNRLKSEELRPFKQYWNAMMEHFDLSLRDEEQILSILNISFHTIPNNQLTFPVLLAYFATLKVVNPGLFRKCKTSLHSENRIPFPHKEIIDFFHVKTGFNAKDYQYDTLADEDQMLYEFLCATLYRHDKEYQRKIDHSLRESVDEEEITFSQNVREVSISFYGKTHVTSNLIDSFETLDSISGFVFDAERKHR